MSSSSSVSGSVSATQAVSPRHLVHAPVNSDAAVLPSEKRRSVADASVAIVPNLPPQSVDAALAPRSRAVGGNAMPVGSAAREAALARALENCVSRVVDLAAFKGVDPADVATPFFEAEEAFKGLLQLGVPYAKVKNDFVKAMNAKLSTLDLKKLHKVAKQLDAALSRFSRNDHGAVVLRAMALSVRDMDLWQMHRDARDLDHQKHSTNPGLKAFRKVKGTLRGIDAKAGARSKFLEVQALNKSAHERFCTAVTGFLGDFAAAAPANRMQVIGRKMDDLQEIAVGMNLNDFRCHLEAALLTQNPVLVCDLRTVLRDRQSRNWLASDHSLFNQLGEAVAGVAELYPAPAPLVFADAAFEGRPRAWTLERRLSVESKHSPDMPVPRDSPVAGARATDMTPVGQASEIAKKRIHGEAMALAMALGSQRELTPEQMSAFRKAMEAICESIARSASSGLDRDEAFDAVSQGVRQAFAGLSPSQVKNAEAHTEWLKLVGSKGSILERAVIRALLDLNLKVLHREVRDNQHAVDAANAKGLKKLAQPVLAFGRGVKDLARGIDNTYLSGKDALQAQSADAQLRGGLGAHAGLAVAATRAESSEREARLLNAITALVDFELPEGPNLGERVLAHMEDALVYESIDGLVRLAGELNNGLLMPYVTRSLGETNPTLIPRLDTLSLAVKNVRGLYRDVPLPAPN